MIITDSFKGVNRLFLDTAPIIYYVERNPKYLASVRVVFQQISNGLLIGVASPVTLAECLVRPYILEQTELQQNFIELITNTNNIEYVPISDQNIALGAAQIRAKYNLKLPDAFQIAVALTTNCDAFFTNDAIFKRITEIQVLVLDDFEEG